MLSLVEEDLHHAAAVELDADSLTHDLSRVDQVIEDGRVDRRQSAAAWNIREKKKLPAQCSSIDSLIAPKDRLSSLKLLAGSLLLLLVARLFGRFRQDAPLGDEDDVASAELLLQLPDQTRLDLLVGLELGHGDEDDDGAFAAAHVHLLRRRHV